jgi:hypothetical protein
MEGDHFIMKSGQQKYCLRSKYLRGYYLKRDLQHNVIGRSEPEKMATCQICGTGDEDGHHAVVTCTKARAHRYKMRECWQLPGEKQFNYSGPDWLLTIAVCGG